MACKISELGAVIAAEIGKTETPAHSNKTKYGKWYRQDGQAWCDMYQAWCANQVGATDICGKFAYTPFHARFFKNKGAWYTTPKKGDYAFFHDGKRICHIGWVEKVIDSNTVQTIEGNTGSSSNTNGGQVQRRKRSISGTPKWRIVGFGRPAYLDEVAAGGSVNTNPQMQKYTVQPGDSLWKIAEKYQVNLDEVRNANPDIHDPNNLQVGKVINIPNAQGGPINTNPHMQQHKVKQGETLYLIAQQYKVNVDDIKKANQGIDPENLPVGSTVNIPIDAGGTVNRHPGNAPAGTPNTNTFKPKGISKEDFQMLIRITEAEAEDQGYIGKAAVAASILNRVNNPEYKSPKNIYAVLHQRGQYSPMSDGRYGRVNPKNEETKKAVQAAVDGYDPSNGATVFWNPKKVGYNAWLNKRQKTVKIKDHQFAK
jgi:LysM repeat protein